MGKLNNQQRREMVFDYQHGASPTMLSKRFGVSVAYVIKASREKVSKRAAYFEAQRQKKAAPPPIAEAPKTLRFPQQVGSGRHTSSGYLKLI